MAKKKTDREALLAQQGKSHSTKARSPPDANVYNCTDQDGTNAAPSSAFKSTSDAQSTDGATYDIRCTHEQPEKFSQQLPSISKRRRGRPSKGASAHEHQTSPYKTVALSPLADRRRSDSSTAASLSPQTGNTSVVAEKKTRLRARNREAAHKCRVRKQRGVEDLQSQEAAIGAANQALKDQHAELHNEVLLLKGMILQHGGCGCSFIESYIEDAAASLSQKANDLITGPQGSSGSPISPAASWSFANPQEQGLSGLDPFEVATGNEPYFGWNMLGGHVNLQERAVMEL